MKSPWTAVAATVFAILAIGCSKGEQDVSVKKMSPAAAEQEKAAQKALSQTYPRVEIQTDAGLYWFEPRRCTVGPESGSTVVSYSIEGAGKSPEGEPVYVTLEDEDNDLAHGPEMRINVGTDQPMKTPEIVWIANDQAASSLSVPRAKVNFNEKRVTLEGVVFTRNGNNRLTAKAPISVDCGLPK